MDDEGRIDHRESMLVVIGMKKTRRKNTKDLLK